MIVSETREYILHRVTPTLEEYMAVVDKINYELEGKEDRFRIKVPQQFLELYKESNQNFSLDIFGMLNMMNGSQVKITNNVIHKIVVEFKNIEL